MKLLSHLPTATPFKGSEYANELEPFLFRKLQYLGYDSLSECVALSWLLFSVFVQLYFCYNFKLLFMQSTLCSFHSPLWNIIWKIHNKKPNLFNFHFCFAITVCNLLLYYHFVIREISSVVLILVVWSRDRLCGRVASEQIVCDEKKRGRLRKKKKTKSTNKRETSGSEKWKSTTATMALVAVATSCMPTAVSLERRRNIFHVNPPSAHTFATKRIIVIIIMDLFVFRSVFVGGITVVGFVVCLSSRPRMSYVMHDIKRN